MAYTATLTITGVAGPGNTVTAAVYTGVSQVTFDVANSVVRFTDSDGKEQAIAVSTTLTVTVTVSSGNYTISVS
jgi:hypothetical protein